MQEQLGGLWGPLGRQPSTSEVWFGGPLQDPQGKAQGQLCMDMWNSATHTEGTEDIQEETEDPDSPWLLPPNGRTNGCHVQPHSSQQGRFMKYSSSVTSRGC